MKKVLCFNFIIMILFLFNTVSFAQNCNMMNKKDSAVSDSSSHKAGNHKMMEDACCSTDKKAVGIENDADATAWNAVCPVMGSEVDPDADKVEYDGKVYGFCCNGCDTKFTKNPAKYSKHLSEDGLVFTGKKEKH